MEAKTEEKFGRISLNGSFSCQKCRRLAYQPFVSDCCQAILCSECLRSSFKCPLCDKICKLRTSSLLTSIYKNIMVECQFRCGSKLPLSSMTNHLINCPDATKECSYCKAVIKIRLLPDHLGEKHIEECNRIILDFHKSSSDKRSGAGLSPSINIQKIKPFKVGTTGNFNIEPRICLAGRLVCGRPLVDDRSVNVSSSFFQPKQRDVCSLEHGSCDRCMMMDMDRLGLPVNHLLNLQGRISLYLRDRKTVACGCSNGPKTCNEQVQCGPCKRLLAMIQRGFYKRCIQQIV